MSFWSVFLVILGISIFYGFITGEFLFAWITGFIGAGIIGIGFFCFILIIILGSKR